MISECNTIAVIRFGRNLPLTEIGDAGQRHCRPRKGLCLMGSVEVHRFPRMTEKIEKKKQTRRLL